MGGEFTLFYTLDGRRRAITARPGQTVLAALQNAGVTALPAPCGGAGSCGKCRVRAEGLGWVLACRTPAAPGMELFLAGQGAAAIFCQGALRPWEALPPDPWVLDGPAGGPGTDGPAAGSAAAVLGTGGPAAGGLANAFAEDADKAAPLLGAAVDLGTTTLVVHLHDLATGRRLASAGEANAQGPFGADVVRRIAACEGGGLARLAGAVRGQLSRITAGLLAGAGAGPSALRAVCVAGNTIMLHILAGLSPASMGQAPFTPLTLFGGETPGHELGVEAWQNARVLLCPCVAGYLGGDITAGLLACGLGLPPAKQGSPVPGWRLFLDIGTNGEMALAGPDGILCCATAAGPAFEGAGITLGMAGAAGAVSGVCWGPAGPAAAVLGGGPARGVCGSGLVEAAAMLRAVGALDASGRLLRAEEAEAAGGEELADWLGEEGGQPAAYLTPDRRVYLTQSDIRQLQMAKAAVAAGITALLQAAGVGAHEVQAVYLAGGFGSCLSVKSARAIGLLPPALAAPAQAVGNAAGEGAALALLRRDARRQLGALAGRCRYLELATDPFFMQEYLEQMHF